MEGRQGKRGESQSSWLDVRKRGEGGGSFRCIQSATWGVGGLKIGKIAYVINGRPLTTHYVLAASVTFR